MGMGEDFLMEGYPPKTLLDAVGEPTGRSGMGRDW